MYVQFSFLNKQATFHKFHVRQWPEFTFPNIASESSLRLVIVQTTAKLSIRVSQFCVTCAAYRFQRQVNRKL